jgi:hypothetical protein
MIGTVENLILDLVEWVGRKERTYQETMDAWRTSCPRLTVWEDATDRGRVQRAFANGHSLVRVTPAVLIPLRSRDRMFTSNCSTNPPCRLVGGIVDRPIGRQTLRPNKGLEPKATTLGSWVVARSHSTVVAVAHALPMAVAELGRYTVRQPEFSMS